MTQGRSNRVSAVILVAVFIFLLHGTVPAQAAPTLEARFVLDSNACLMAVDLWLHSIEDTVVGFEIVLQWDRPDFGHFRLDSLESPDSLNVMDSLADARQQLSRGIVSKPIPIIELDGTILENWSYVEGRTKDGIRVKITGLMDLISRSGATPLYPCDSIRLFRLPIDRLAYGNEPFADSTAGVLVDPSQTRLSTNWGNLVGGLRFVGAVAHFDRCEGTILQK